MSNPRNRRRVSLIHESDELNSKEDGGNSENLDAKVILAHSSQTAEGALSLPQQFSRADSVALLLRAVSALEQGNRRTAAAGVAARMRQFEPDFRLSTAGYSGFRELLEEAEAAGLVYSQHVGSDVDIHTKRPTNETASVPRLPSDLWRAFLEWDEGINYFFDTRTGRTRRATGAKANDGEVQVPSIRRDAQVAWMRAFAEGLDSEPARVSLLDGLGKVDPAHGFSAAARQHPNTARRWKRYLQQRVLERAIQWAQENGVQIDVEEALPVPPSPGPVAPAADGDGLRAQILEVLGSMPLHELLQLRIPAAYAIRR